MMIGKFNRLTAKHGKVLFGIITIVIGVSFVGFFSPSARNLFRSGHQSPDTVLLTVFNKSITNKMVTERTRDALIASAVQGGAFVFSNQFFYSMASRNAPTELVMLQAAKELNIGASDKEIIDYVKKSPQFLKDGKFDVEAYKKFTELVKQRIGVGPKSIDKAVREALTLQKLNREILGDVITTDSEAKQFYNNYNAKVSASLLVLDANDSDVKITDEALKKFFDDNKKNYMTAIKYDVVVASFKNVAFIDELKTSLTEADCLKYYSDNKSAYKKDGKVLAFKDVKDKVKKDLILSKSEDLAYNSAEDFANAFYDSIADAKNKADMLKAFYAEYKNVKNKNLGGCLELGWISEEDKKFTKIGSVPTLVTEVAKAYDDVPVTDPIVTKAAVYVAFLKEREESKVADYETVKDEVKKDYLAQESLKLVKENAKEIAAKISAQLAKGKKFNEIKEAKKFKKLPIFTVRDETNPEIPQLRDILPAVLKTKNNSVSELIDTKNGAMLLYVEGRTTPSNKDYDEHKAESKEGARNLKLQSMQRSFGDWIDANMQKN